MKTILLLLAVTSSLDAAFPTKPVLFVTQVPMPDEINSHTDAQCKMSCASPIQNPLGDTASAGRGGALMIYYPAALNPATSLGSVVNLTAKAGFGVVNASGVSSGLQAGANAIAVQHPCLDWSGTKAIFSMVVGAPATAADTTTFHWQLYEITNFDKASVAANTGPLITKVPNQPASYNNLHACYGTNGRILFTSDRPRNGQANLYPQRDEYLVLPCNTGLWSLDPTSSASGNLFQIAHMPSGAFSPILDSYGRLLFSQWDHLVRDRSTVYDRPPVAANGENWAITTNGMGNWDSEAPSSIFTAGTNDQYPEPRNFDQTSLLTIHLNGHTTNGNAFNFFLLWMIHEDGSNHEIINHMGRQELHRSGTGVLAAGVDPNILAFDATVAPVRKYVDHMLAVVESPLSQGLYYGIDAPDLGTHGAGQIFTLTGSPNLNPDPAAASHMTLNYLAPTSNAAPKPSNFANVYRNACPMTDGALLASWSTATAFDVNIGTATAPLSRFDFRLKTLKPGNAALGEGLIPDQALTSGLLGINLQWYSNGATISYNGPLWELDPVEVVSRNKPTTLTAPIDPVEQQVFNEEGVDAPTLQSYLRSRDLALIVSRDVTRRDKADKQQPYNLRITGTNHQTVANAGQLYDVGWLQIFQADALRGLTNGTGIPVPGRRVLPTLLSAATMAEMPTQAGAPPGAVKLGVDGSLAAIVPARKGVTWHLTAGAGANTESIVKERFWVNFAPGEVRSCTNCHGLNNTDQAGQLKPTNKPEALRELLQFWKLNNPPGVIQHSISSITIPKASASVQVQIARSGGSTGPVSVSYTTADGSAAAGSDYQMTSGMINWLDGDSASKPITVLLSHNATVAPNKTFTVVLSSPLNAALGPISTATVTLAESAFDAWRVTKFAAAANTAGTGTALDDPDGDGTSNLLEYALGGNPLVADAAMLPVGSTATSNGASFLTLAFTRAASDIDYTVEVTNDLTAWSTGSSYAPTGNILNSPSTTDITPAGQAPGFTLVRDNTSVTGSAHRFMHLKVKTP